MHKNYFDDHSHGFLGIHRWPGFRPWQDMSSMVQGAVLYDLNDNFCKAWDKKSNEGLYAKRSELQPEDFVLGKKVPKSTKIQYLVDAAQICRTEPSYDEQTILSLYKKAVGNAKSYLYMENQYFRYGALADYLKEISKTRKEGANSCDGSRKDMYLFVVTNQPNSAGEVPYTFDMLTRLGAGDQLPLVQRNISEKYVYNQHRIKKYEEKYNMTFNETMNKWLSSRGLDKDITYDDIVDWAAYRTQEEYLTALYPDLPNAYNENSQIDKKIRNTDNTEKAEDAITMKLADEVGLKVLIGALKSCIEVRDKKGRKTGKFYYTKVYVHSKLLIVDDAFLTLGSTNINTRSFKVDSELNIAVPNCQVAKETREKLWGIHAKKCMEGENVQIRAEKNHEYWKEMMSRNWKHMYDKENLL